MELENEFWLNNPRELFKKFTDIFPQKTNHNPNAIGRFFIIGIIIIYVSI